MPCFVSGTGARALVVLGVARVWSTTARRVGRAVRVDVVAAVDEDVVGDRRGEPRELLVADRAAVGAHLLDDLVHVERVPGDDRVCDERERGGLGGLAVQVGDGDAAFAAVEDTVVERVEAFVLVELAADRGVRRAG